MHRHSILKRTINTQERSQIIDLTAMVQDLVQQHRVEDGLAVVFVPHTTAGVTINENADPDVKRDLLSKLEQLVPRHETFYQHGEGNSDSHLKTVITGNSATVLIEGNRLMLGTWQGLYFCEFDGPRQRQVWIKLIDLRPE
jgi:secondary thiamine-phosphate synthase enzyme